MSSMLYLSLSILMFVIVWGFMWLIGQYVLAQFFDYLPVIDESSPWRAFQDTIKDQVSMISIWVIPVAFVVVVIKALMAAGGRGDD